MSSQAADTYRMSTTDNGDVVRFVTADGRPAIRREWQGWKAGLPGTGKPEPEKHGPRRPSDQHTPPSAA